MSLQPDTPQAMLSSRDASTHRDAASAALPAREHGPRSTRLGNFTLEARVLLITGLARVVGAAGRVLPTAYFG